MLVWAPHSGFNGQSLEAAALGGRVLDLESGDPVAGAILHISWEGRSPLVRATRTDTDGVFFFAKVPAGRLHVKVEALGFASFLRAIENASDSLHLDLRLTPLPLLMGEIVARARRGGGGYVGAFVESIPIGDGRAFGADLAQVLGQATGVNIRRYGGLGSSSTISIRGSTAEQVTVYLDGVALNSALGGGVDLGSLPLGGIEAVEIYRGSVPGRFGGNSLGGVVHIRTLRPPFRSTVVRVNGGSGSFGNRRFGISMSGSFRDWQYVGLLDHNRSRNDFRFWDDNATEYNAADDNWTRRLNSEFESWRMLGKATWKTRAGSVRVNHTFDLQSKGIPGIGSNQARRTRYSARRHISEASLSGSHGRSGYRFQAHNGIEREDYQDPRGEIGVGARHTRNLTHSLSARGEWNRLFVQKSLATVFSSVSRELFIPDNRLDIRNDRRSARRTVSLGAELEQPVLHRRFLVNAGARVENRFDRLFRESEYAAEGLLRSVDRMETIWCARLGVSAEPRAGWKLQGHVGRYARPPGFFELFGDQGAVVGNSELVSETGKNLDAGIVFRGEADSGTGVLHAEVVSYRNRVENLIRFVQNSQQVSRPHNIGASWLQGVETRIQARLCHRGLLVGNYVYQHAENRSDFTFERGKDLPGAPRHRLGGSVGVMTRRLDGRYEVIRESHSFLDKANLRPVAQRTLHNLGVDGVIAHHTRLSVEFRNITDNQISDVWGYPLPGRSYFLALTYDTSPAIDTPMVTQ